MAQGQALHWSKESGTLITTVPDRSESEGDEMKLVEAVGILVATIEHDGPGDSMILSLATPIARNLETQRLTFTSYSS